MKTLTVHTSKEYDVLIGKGLLDRAGDEVQKRLHPAKAVIVTDSNVGPLYAAAVKRSLQTRGIQAAVFTFPAGEAQKRLSTIAQMYEVFAATGLTRGDLAVALGGGVTGDMCGFASATYLRGIPFVPVSYTHLDVYKRQVLIHAACIDVNEVHFLKWTDAC